MNRRAALRALFATTATVTLAACQGYSAPSPFGRRLRVPWVPMHSVMALSVWQQLLPKSGESTMRCGCGNSPT